MRDTIGSAGLKSKKRANDARYNSSGSVERFPDNLNVVKGTEEKYGRFLPRVLRDDATSTHWYSISPYATSEVKMDEPNDDDRIDLT